MHLNKVNLYFFPESFDECQSNACTQTGEKLKRQTHGIAAHKISEERQSWQGREQQGARHVEWE